MIKPRRQMMIGSILLTVAEAQWAASWPAERMEGALSPETTKTSLWRGVNQSFQEEEEEGAFEAVLAVVVHRCSFQPRRRAAAAVAPKAREILSSWWW